MYKVTTLKNHSKDVKELNSSLIDAKEELFNLRFQIATGQLENTASLKKVKKKIARIYTQLREQELGIVNTKTVEGKISE